MKLKMNSKGNYSNYTNVETGQHILNVWWAIEEVKRQNKNFMEANKYINKAYNNLENVAMAFLKGIVIALSSYIKNSERSQVNNNLMMHPKDLGKQEQVKPKSSIRKEIIKIRAKINEIKSKRTIQRG
jgi:hypothetical protein